MSHTKQHFRILSKANKRYLFAIAATLLFTPTAFAMPSLTPNLTGIIAGTSQKVTVNLALHKNASTPYRFLAGFKSTDFGDSLHATPKLRDNESAAKSHTYTAGPKKLTFVLHEYASNDPYKSKPIFNISPECDIQAPLKCEYHPHRAEQSSCTMDVGQTNPNSNPQIDFIVTQDVNAKTPTYEINCDESGFGN